MQVEPTKRIFADSSLKKRLAVRALRAYARFIPSERSPLVPSDSADIRILVQSMGGIGNTLMATPIFLALRELYPAAQIDLLTSPGAAELLKHEPMLSNIIADQSGDDHSRGGYLRINRGIRDTHYDAAVLPLNAVTFRFAIRSVLARVPRRIVHRYAFKRQDDYLSAFTQIVARETGRHDVLCNFDLIKHLSGTVLQPGPLRLTLKPSATTEARSALVNAGWAPEKPSIAIAPGSSDWMAFKRWPMESYVQLALTLADSNPTANIVVHFGPDEEKQRQEWRSSPAASCTTLVGGVSIAAYAACIQLSDVVITNDSLPMHIAAALQRPVVALFGPTDPRHTGPWHCPSKVIQSDADFAPYFEHPYPLNPDKFPNCMERISVNEVVAGVEALLATSDSSELNHRSQT